MNHGRREKAQSGMAVFVVIPGEELLGERTSILQRAETFRETGPVLQSSEVAFRIRVVVGDMRAAVGFSDGLSQACPSSNVKRKKGGETMAVLKSQKRELFAQGLAKGQAARNAGFSEKFAQVEAYRLCKNPAVLSRVAELRLRIANASAKASEAVLLAAEDESAVAAPFVRNLIRDRAYRLTVYQEMLDELRDPKQLVNDKGQIRAAIYEKTLAVLKQAAIESGDWEDRHRIAVDRGPDLSHLTTEQLLEEQKILREAREKLEALHAPKPSAGLIDAAPGSVEEIRNDG